jgi:hypothetical protein
MPFERGEWLLKFAHSPLFVWRILLVCIVVQQRISRGEAGTTN